MLLGEAMMNLVLKPTPTQLLLPVCTPDFANATVKIKVLKVKFGNLGENQAHADYCWNVNNGRYTSLKHGAPKWDNKNWITSDKNPFDIAKTLDIEFENVKQLL